MEENLTILKHLMGINLGVRYINYKNNDFLINNNNLSLGYKDTDKIKWVELYNNIKIIILDKNHLIWDKIKEIIK